MRYQRPSLRPSRLYHPATWHRDHRFGVTSIIVSTLVIAGIGFLGPSAVTLGLGPRVVDGRQTYLPPYYLPTGTVPVNPWAATFGLYGAIILGALGLWVCLRALEEGWRPRVSRLFPLGAILNVLVALVPPLTSADVLMYAAYGRLQAIGQDPYEITPALIFRSQYDPVLRWTERPWQDTPSVYGPLTSLSQVVANWLGGQSMHDIVFWLQMFCLVPLLAIGAILVTMARGNPLLQMRATLLTVLNPVIIWAVLSGAHNEALAVVFGVAALALMRRGPFWAGLALGFAGATKVNMVLYGVAVAWGYRREPRKLVPLVLGAAIPLVGFYAVWQPQALFAASRNTMYVNAGAWAGPAYGLLVRWLTDGQAKVLLNVISLVMWALVGYALSRLLPWRPLPGIRHDVDPRHDPMTVAVRAAAILYVSWLVTTPNAFSWYDLLAWAPLALAAGSRLDGLMIWRTTWLSLAFVVARGYAYSPALNFVGARVRDTLCVTAQVLVLVAIARWWARREHGLERRHWPEPGEDPWDLAVAPGRDAAVARVATPESPEVGDVSAPESPVAGGPPGGGRTESSVAGRAESRPGDA